MTSKQRAKLRSMATDLDTIFQVGKSEISENMATQISNALEARELIKVHVLDNSPYTPREAAEELASMVNAEVNYRNRQKIRIVQTFSKKSKDRY